MTELVATARRRKRRKTTPEREFMRAFYASNEWWVLAGVIAISLFFTWYLNSEILTDQVYYYSLSGKIGAEKLVAFVDAQHRSHTLSFLFVPVVLLLKMTLVSLCLLTGLLLSSEKMSFRDLFKIAIFAELAPATGLLFKLFLLCFFHNVETLDQYTTFAPLSVYSLLKAGNVPFWLSYPLQTLDLFQVAYVFLLTMGLTFFHRQPFKKMLWLVLGSYGVGLLCCMIGFAFFTFSNS